MSISKIIIIFLEVLLLAVFVIPVLLNITNAGNIAGILASGILLLATIFNHRIWEFIKHICQNVPGRILVIFTALVLTFGVCFAGFLTVRMVCSMNNTPTQPTTVVVLGCHVKGSEPSLMLKRRLDAAYEYLVLNPDVKCVVTGGQGTGESISEAEAMKNYLMNKGIDENRILEENKSTSTYENIAFSKKILEENTLNNDIVIVTDGFHQYRAGIIAKKQGLNAYSISCPTRPELVPTYWVREWLALANEIFLS